MRDYPYLPVIERVGHFGAAEVKHAMDENRALITDEDGEWFVLHWRETYWGRGEATLRLIIPAGGLPASKLDRLNRLYGIR